MVTVELTEDMVTKSFSELKKNLKNQVSGLKSIRLALLGDTATQFLGQALQGAGVDQGFDLHIWEADFSQIERQVFDPGSELYAFKPEIIIVFLSTHKLLNIYNKTKPERRSEFASQQLALVTRIHGAIHEQIKGEILFYNFPEIDDSVFGNYSNKMEGSFPYQLRKLNYELMLLAAKTSSFHLCDMSLIQNRLGKRTLFQSSIYINTEMVLSFDALPEVAARTWDLIAAMHGKVRKCLVLDLDNTLWGGVIGDDGIENIEIGNLGIGKAMDRRGRGLRRNSQYRRRALRRV